MRINLNTNTRYKRPGFTLIELLVVVAIISLLIAILLPSLGRAREQSRKSVCLANLRSLAQAMHLYAYENRDKLPNLNAPGSSSDLAGATKALVGLYGTFVPATKTFHCPSDADPVPVSITTADFAVPNSARVSYDFYSVWWIPEHGPNLPRIDKAPLAWDLDGGSPTITPLQNHGNTGGNVSFGDGHAEWQPTKEWDKPNWPHPGDQYYQ